MFVLLFCITVCPSVELDLPRFSTAFPLVALHTSSAPCLVTGDGCAFYMVTHASKKPVYQVLLQMQMHVESGTVRPMFRAFTQVQSDGRLKFSSGTGAPLQLHSLDLIKEWLGRGVQNLFVSQLKYMLRPPGLCLGNLAVETSFELPDSKSKPTTSCYPRVKDFLLLFVLHVDQCVSAITYVRLRQPRPVLQDLGSEKFRGGQEVRNGLPSAPGEAHCPGPVYDPEEEAYPFAAELADDVVLEDRGWP